MANPQSADDDLATVRKSLEDANASAAEAARTAAAATAENEQLKAKVGQAVYARVSADLAAATNAIAASENEAAALEKDLAEAGNKQDWSAMATIQRKLASAQGRIDGWVNRKAQIENYIKNEAAKAVAQPKEEQTQTATTKTQEWMDRHPDIVNDKKLWNKALAAHYEAEAEGVVVESPEYFKRIEQAVGLIKDDGGADAGGGDDARSGASDETPAGIDVDLAEGVRPKPKEETGVTTAASPSRPGNRVATPKKGQVRLTEAQQEAARISWPGLKPEEAYVEYAKNVVALQKEGRL